MSLFARPRYILDTSIALKWYLNDETHVEQSRALLLLFNQQRIELLAPQHIHYEVANALRIAVNRRRLSELHGRRAVDSFFALDVPVVSDISLILHSWEMASRYGCAVYDGLYVALAETTGLPFIHADRRLHNTLKGRFPHELWIEDFDSGSPDPA